MSAATRVLRGSTAPRAVRSAAIRRTDASAVVSIGGAVPAFDIRGMKLGAHEAVAQRGEELDVGGSREDAFALSWISAHIYQLSRMKR
jgi:hypothetical protein